MRIKYYLRGIGCGIIFAVIIMSIAFGNREKQQISDAEIIQRAKQLGMVDADTVDGESETERVSSTEAENNGKIVVEQQNKDNKGELDNKNQDNKGQGSVDALANKTSDAEGETVNKQNDKNNSEKNKEKDKEEKNREEKNNTQASNPNAVEKEEYVTITIKSGQVCRQIAEDLQKQGIIDDAEAFREYMGRRGLASSIRCGTFKLPKGASYQKIADYLINK